MEVMELYLIFVYVYMYMNGTEMIDGGGKTR